METNNIQLFNYESKQVRTFEKDGLIWFVATDVAEITGHKRIRSSINRILDTDEAHIVGGMDKSGKFNNIQVINESGLYKLLFRSKLPQAKAFTKYVTSVILPTIRKTGSFSIKNTDVIKEYQLKQALEVKTDQRRQLSQQIKRIREDLAVLEEKRFSSCVPGFHRRLQPDSEPTQYSLF